MREGIYTQLVSYFEAIAAKHPQINYFHELDEQEIIAGKLRRQIQYPALIMEDPDIGFSDNRTNVDQLATSGFAVVGNVKPGDEARMKEVKRLTESIILDIISQMREDRRKAIIHLETNDLQIHKVGPAFSDNCYGWRLEFRFRKWVDLDYREEEWQ